MRAASLWWPHSHPSSPPQASVAKNYLITSVAYVPVLGGVIEYGASDVRPWRTREDAFAQVVP